jgi:hypothetical protein
MQLESLSDNPAGGLQVRDLRGDPVFGSVISLVRQVKEHSRNLEIECYSKLLMVHYMENQTLDKMTAAVLCPVIPENLLDECISVLKKVTYFDGGMLCPE